jgi:hypothetical protein
VARHADAIDTGGVVPPVADNYHWDSHADERARGDPTVHDTQLAETGVVAPFRDQILAGPGMLLMTWVSDRAGGGP